MKRQAIVSFDPADPQHRCDLQHVMTKRTFHGCQNRYNLEGGYGDVLTMMKSRTLEWYSAREFFDSAQE